MAMGLGMTMRGRPRTIFGNVGRLLRVRAAGGAGWVQVPEAM
jgi:hypothetical protein